MIDFDAIKKPKCYKMSNISNDRDCEAKRKNKGNAREKCQACKFRFYHEYMMEFDEEYAEMQRICLKINLIN